MESLPVGNHVPQPASDLDTYLNFLFEGLQGYVYLAAKKDPKDPNDWHQEYIEYPAKIDYLKSTILKVSKVYEIYIAPVIYSEERTAKETVKASNVVWADFDGNAPDWTDSNGEPSLIIQSSGSKHQHVYWRLSSPLKDVAQLEAINRNIAYNLQADNSGWDATQVLRPPNTLNHKRGSVPVELNLFRPVQYDVEIFNHLAPAPEKPNTEFDLTALPDVQDIVLRYSFPADMVLLFKQDHPKDRSAALMNLAYGCCEMGMDNKEIFAVLLLADDKWKKFKDRKDRNQRLAQMITIAREKHPAAVQEDEEEPFAFVFDYQSFLDTEISIDWVLDPMLMENGSMLMVGPSGIGKTQLSLQFMIHLALGRDYLHYKVNNPQKILFLSLEMDHGSLKQFLLKMNLSLTDSDRLLLAENFQIVPHGEPWALNTPIGQEYLINVLEATEPNGLFIDSIGSSIRGPISSDEAVQPYLDFNDKIRKKYGMFTWAIHHMRKNQPGSNHASTQDDIYGNQYLLNRSTSSYGVLHGKNGLLKVRNFKNRLAPQEKDYLLTRVDNLNFEKFNPEIHGLPKLIANDTTDSPSDPDTKAPNGIDL